MKKLLDATDRRTRRLQHALILGSYLLVGAGIYGPSAELLPAPLAIAAVVLGILILIGTASIKQRWEIDYKGHRIRFENSAITAERLYLDEGLVARGGLGLKMELRAPIRVGEGAGEELMVIADAGFTSFRVRIFVEDDGVQQTAAQPVPLPVSTPPQVRPAYDAAVPDLRPVQQSDVIGKLVLAKHLLEAVAALIAVTGAVGAAVLWLL